MGWFVVSEIFSVLLEVIILSSQSEQNKDLEILLLRRQLAMVERKLDEPLRISRAEKLTLAVLAVKLKASTRQTARQMKRVIRVFQPETVFKWHREMVRRKWTFNKRGRGGRPRTDKEIERLVVRLAKENGWGNGKIEGELVKLGYTISDETVGDILRRNNIPPVPERETSPSWRHLMTHYCGQILACDFFTVETLFLKTLYVLFFIEVGSRQVYFAGCTTHPNGEWVTQKGRQMVWEFEDRTEPMRFLLRDNDSKFTGAFDTVFAAERIKVIKTPYRAPNANAYAERWVRTVREECLDKILILNDGHLRRVMCEYVKYYNEARPHQGIEQQVPVPKMTTRANGPIRCRNVLGGIIHDYYREVA